jgi:putative transposase
VDYLISHWGISQRRACRLIKQPRSNQFYCSRKDPRTDLRQRMREIANARIRYGYPEPAR